MGSIGWTEILVIALIAVLLFGAGRIADIGKGLGQGIKNFKEGIKDAGDSDDEDEEEEVKPAKKKVAKSSDKTEKKVEKKEKVEVKEEATEEEA
jgi:sec-independent protein translocase protein TatA